MREAVKEVLNLSCSSLKHRFVDQMKAGNSFEQANGNLPGRGRIPCRPTGGTGRFTKQPGKTTLH